MDVVMYGVAAMCMLNEDNSFYNDEDTDDRSEKF